MTLSENTKNIQSFIQTHHNVENISEKEINIFYVQLIDCLVDHNHQYYIENNPLISDKEYDELFDYLKKIEEHFPQLITSNSPTQWLIGQISEWFSKKEHIQKLLSLENTYNAEDLREREERIYKKIDSESKIIYSVEPKFDGLSVELIYENGKLISAITRGDWLVGEEIVVNAKTITWLEILKTAEKKTLHVRWEIVMPKSIRKEINKEREEEWETPFANTRNAAAGSIKLLDSNEVKKRKLSCFIYDVLLRQKGNTIDSNSVLQWYLGWEETYELLKKYWLPVFPRRKKCNSIEEVISICNDPATKKYLEQQDIDFDGLVIKVKDAEQRDNIWETDHHPRRAVAYKFPAQLAATQILSVDFQVGRTGVITPVANLQPVQLSGAKLQRVSLHNFDFIKEKDLHINDWIWLQRSGEVIPYIVSVITDRRTTQNAEFKIQNEITPPKNCPSCHEAVTQKDMHYYCTNPQCTQKVKQQIEHFVSKNCMDIQGIGESVIDILVENKIIKNIADIYKLPEQNIQITLRKFPGIGDKKVAEIAKGIEESKYKALRRLLNWLWVPHVGKKMAQDLAEAIQSSLVHEGGEFRIQNEWKITDILTNKEFLSSIYGIGEKSVETIATFFSDQKNLHLLEQLKNYGVNLDPKKYSDHINTDTAKWSFSITWSFAISREKIADLFKEQGYIFHESPIKTTDFMLIGEKAGSKKTKAQELWITIYEWWETIIKQFPFLKTIPNKKKNTPTVQSLF